MEALCHPDLKVSAKVKKALKDMYTFWIKGLEIDSQKDITALVDFVIKESGYIAYLYDNDPIQADLTMDNIEEFLSIAKAFDMKELDYEDRCLSVFLEEIALYTDLDQSDGTDNTVSLMTMHSSKGLEFPVVFVAGFEDNLFPHFRAKKEGCLEEERRLCYVAFTRAKEYLFITSASKRLLHGKFAYDGPSDFMDELNGEYYTNISEKRYHKNIIGATRKKEAVPEAAYSVGDRVMHTAWGEGMVVSVDASSPKITVAFPNEGIKTLATEFAPIKKL